MDLVVVSDFHGEVEAARGVVRLVEDRGIEAIVICGDITHAGTEEDAEYLLNTLLDATPNVLYVSGNFDPPEIMTGVAGSRAICLHGKSHLISPYTFVGVSCATPAPFFSPSSISDEEIGATLNRALGSVERRDKLILVSHDPPNSSALDKTSRGSNVGSKSVKQFILREKPILAACGHIHESPGVDKINSTIAVNPGPAFTRRAALVKLEPEVLVTLTKI